MAGERREYNDRRNLYKYNLNERSKCNGGDDIECYVYLNDNGYLSSSGDECDYACYSDSKHSSKSKRSDLCRNISNLYSNANEWRSSTDLSMESEWCEYDYRRYLYDNNFNERSKCHSGNDIKRYVYLNNDGNIGCGSDECNNSSYSDSKYSSKSDGRYLCRNIGNVHTNPNEWRNNTNVPMESEWGEYDHRRYLYDNDLDQRSKCHSGNDIEC